MSHVKHLVFLNNISDLNLCERTVSNYHNNGITALVVGVKLPPPVVLVEKHFSFTKQYSREYSKQNTSNVIQENYIMLIASLDTHRARQPQIPLNPPHRWRGNRTYFFPKYKLCIYTFHDKL